MAWGAPLALLTGMLVKNDIRRQRQREAGYSLVELLTIVAIIGILCAIAVPVSTTFVQRSKADGAVAAAVAAIDVGRNRAIAERRNVEIHFDVTNRVRLVRQEPDGTTTTLSDLPLENGLELNRIGGTGAPEGFDGVNEVNFDGPEPVMFTSDGTLVDAAGDPTNGLIFFSRGNNKDTARAITLFGMTGLIQSWTLAGSAWVQ